MQECTIFFDIWFDNKVWIPLNTNTIEGALSIDSSFKIDLVGVGYQQVISDNQNSRFREGKNRSR